MLFFTVLFVLVLVNFLLLMFSVNKATKTKNKQNGVFKVKENISGKDYLSKDDEPNIVYKKAI